MEDVFGNSISLRAHQNKWLVLNLWADWCHECYKEFPELVSFHDAHMKDAVVLGVNFDGLAAEKIKAIVESQGLTYPMIREFPMKEWGLDTIPALPATIIYSPDRRMKRLLIGGQTQADLEAALLEMQSKLDEAET